MLPNVVIGRSWHGVMQCRSLLLLGQFVFIWPRHLRFGRNVFSFGVCFCFMLCYIYWRSSDLLESWHEEFGTGLLRFTISYCHLEWIGTVLCNVTTAHIAICFSSRPWALKSMRVKDPNPNAISQFAQHLCDEKVKRSAKVRQCTRGYNWQHRV